MFGELFALQLQLVDFFAELLGFGSGAPVTKENYTRGQFTSYQGKALAVLRAGVQPGEVRLTVTAGDIGSADITLQVRKN